MDQDQQIEIKADGQTVTVRFLIPTITDPTLIAEVAGGIKEVIEQHRPVTLIFDFEKVRFFTSQVLGLLLQARTALQPLGGRVVIKSLSENLSRVFKVTYLDRYFEFAYHHSGPSEKRD